MNDDEQSAVNQEFDKINVEKGELIELTLQQQKIIEQQKEDLKYCSDGVDCLQEEIDLLKNRLEIAMSV